ncbi:hypothetical protein Dda_4677 [Drechslerella dactyloides]|uniref:Cerato-platanin n=1 Tax=Drechslerella dactyloides TaxID=74499 RepID=A0AAD6IXS5_DREDA|nr:hypothetical protein Dda_4677 [Drechslerella dactyloides]
MVRILNYVSLLAAAVSATSVSWDPVYDNAGQSLATVACSDGANGLLTKFPDVKTLGDLKGKLKPNVYPAGVSEITGWNNPSCGKCFRLKYKSRVGGDKQIFLVAVDTAPLGANVPPTGFNNISPTGNTAPGRLEVVVYPAGPSDCFK